MTCAHCEEEIVEEDVVTATELSETGFAKIYLHRECSSRMVIGSLAHLQRRCGCYVKGSTEDDPPGMTVREAAKAAWDYYKQHNWEQDAPQLRRRVMRQRMEHYVKVHRH